MPDPRWSAVENRDPRADGDFVYAVLTTGVYCRPSCPARRPRPENVSFHPSPAAAESAGYRPCKRCRPEQTEGPRGDHDKIAALCRHIDSVGHLPTLEELAGLAGWSPWHLQRRFKALVGLSPRAYAAARRAGRLQRELDGDASVTRAIHQSGWNSAGRFYAKAGEALGMKPGDYRKGGAGTEIRFALGQCSLGAILVACSELGVCAILLGDEPEALLRELEGLFPSAVLLGGDEAFESLVARVVGLVEAPALDADLPLDIRGTAFQRRVWDALRKIPAGRTLSYTELARTIGAPRAVRAVASACAANRLAVAIPCHRVVRGDGGLAGYRWGVERKRALLEREADEA